MNSFNLSQFVLLVFPLFIIFGGFFDILKLVVPNNYNFFGFFLFFPLAFYINMPFDVFLIHIVTFFCLLFLGFIAFSLNFFGGGDAKFIAVLGLWIGLESLGTFLLHTAMIGGLLAIMVLMADRFVPIVYQPEILRIMISRKVVPYATAMSIAGLTVYPETDIWNLVMIS